MSLFKTDHVSAFLSLHGSFSIFLFSAISLVIPSGFSYGPVLLVIGSFSLLFYFNRLKLGVYDWIFIGVIFTYCMINFFFNYIHDLPLRSYDRASRFFLAIPAYLFLIAFPPKKIFFVAGIMVGVITTSAFSFYQQFTNTQDWGGRSNGFMNPIQFGDISLLLVAFLLIGYIKYRHSTNSIKVIYLLTLIIGFIGSLFASARGGWLAIPIILIIFLKLAKFKATTFMYVSLICFCIISFFIFLQPDNIIKSRIIEAKLEITNYFNGNNEGRLTSVTTRIKMWENGLIAFKDQPIKGWGSLNAVKETYPSRWKELNHEDNYGHLHNEYIDELVKRGLVGLLGLLALYLVPLLYFYRLTKVTTDTTLQFFSASGVILILSVMIFGLTQTFMAHNSGVIVFIFYLVILKAYCRNHTSVKQNEF